MNDPPVGRPQLIGRRKMTFSQTNIFFHFEPQSPLQPISANVTQICLVARSRVNRGGLD